MARAMDWTPEKVKKLEELYLREVLTIAAIGDAMGVSEDVIKRALRLFDLPLRGRGSALSGRPRNKAYARPKHVVGGGCFLGPLQLFTPSQVQPSKEDRFAALSEHERKRIERDYEARFRSEAA